MLSGGLMAGEGWSDSSDGAASPRRRGRPRSGGAERTILAAGLRLLTERGVQRMSMESVAVAARVSKATIYRRWPSKDALVLDLIALAGGHELDECRSGESGDVRADLVGWLRRSFEDASGPRAAALQHLVQRAAEDPTLAAGLRRRELRLRRERLAAIIERGIRSGQIRPDLDAAVLLDMVCGPLLYHRLLEPASAPPTDPAGRALAIVEIVWPGICAGPAPRAT